MNVVLLQSIVIKVVPLRITLHMRQCDTGRLSHDIAELTGDLQLSLSAHLRRFDKKNSPTNRGPGEAHRHPWNPRLAKAVVVHPWWTEVLFEVVTTHRRLEGPLGDNFGCTLPAELTYHPIELANAGF